MSYITLANILRRPAQPTEIPRVAEWTGVEEHLGAVLPEDYTDFVLNFGTGKINDFLIVLNPFSSNQYVNLINRAQTERQSYETLKWEFPQYYVDVVYPAPSGILPFGVTDNGEVLYWRTAGSPEEWTVTVYESRGPKHFDFQGGMATFLAAILTREIECEVLPRSFSASLPSFNPLMVMGR